MTSPSAPRRDSASRAAPRLTLNSAAMSLISQLDARHQPATKDVGPLGFEYAIGLGRIDRCPAEGPSTVPARAFQGRPTRARPPRRAAQETRIWSSHGRTRRTHGINIVTAEKIYFQGENVMAAIQGRQPFARRRSPTIGSALQANRVGMSANGDTAIATADCKPLMAAGCMFSASSRQLSHTAADSGPPRGVKILGRR